MPSNVLCAACILLGAGLAVGCGGGLVVGAFDCDEETAAAIGSLGLPDARDERSDDGLHIRTLWYEGAGLVVSFTWGDEIPCLREDRVIQVGTSPPIFPMLRTPRR